MNQKKSGKCWYLIKGKATFQPRKQWYYKLPLKLPVAVKMGKTVNSLNSSELLQLQLAYYGTNVSYLPKFTEMFVFIIIINYRFKKVRTCFKF